MLSIKTCFSFLMSMAYLCGFAVTCSLAGQIPLEKPGLFKVTSETTFPSSEAGIAAYVNVGELTSSELFQILLTFDSTKNSDDNFVSGYHTIDNVDIGIYAGMDGWIISYIKKTDDTANIIIPANVDFEKNTLGLTKVESSLSKAIVALDTYFSNYQDAIQFYDFAHPEANALLISLKQADDYVDSWTNDCEFTYLIPEDITLYTSEYYLARSYSTAYYFINDDQIESVNYSYAKSYEGFFSDIPSSYLNSNLPYTVRIEGDEEYHGFGGVIFVYKK
ncbi:MAG: hypothetical protein K9K63_02795 [Desulfotignum sp.]|nr:hypothetical protein [Desulfotignum sp.]MCF8136216.1 hypothetical protein [Desulfotignum sp.]